MNTNKGSVVKQSGNDVEGCRSQKVLFQPNIMRVFLQYSVIKYAKRLGVLVSVGHWKKHKICLFVKSEGQYCQNIPELATENFLEVNLGS